MLFLRKLHKWLGLIVGLQLAAWMLSGLVFALLDHRDVTGEHSTRTPEPAVLTPATSVTDPSTWLGDYAADTIYEVRLAALLDRWVWRIELADRVELRRAEDGAPLQLADPLVRQLALAHYTGGGKLQTLAFHATPGMETRDAGSVWQAQFDDAQRTTLYFAADDGRLVETRNSTWRLFDFFWMLHTMDYEGRDDFNNPLVITVGTAALWLSVSGFLLLLRSFRRRDFDFIGA